MNTRKIKAETIVAIYLSDGPQKIAAAQYQTTQAHVSRIRSGKLYGEVTAPFRSARLRQLPAPLLSASLVTLACTGAA